ncbi:hypothetical protein GYMLUDRAFT_49165 [Collybiopsis luxurians FD-317 M1]|uniref:Zn(2)-C6 fungal-type domain-containing protein n=1 Tax=Collybiopsis luxurians FD-317 M1 TaxID=944289 RepID=A0A0D0ATQ5_9AGAR|nr:hypothetical protein GYMLUDRAFT_49165 [Collybiopsis luxurians FD-317 M1]
MSDSRTCSRPIQSCYQCRKRKIKCNRAYPCAPCLLRGEGDVCREVDRSHSSSSKSTVETLDDVLHRVSVLERVVSRLSKLLPPDLVASGSGEFESTSSIAMAASSSTPKSQTNDGPRPTEPAPSGNKADAKLKSAIRSSYGSVSNDEEAAMMLEDFAMGHRVNRSRAAQDLQQGSEPYSYANTAYGSQGGHVYSEMYETTIQSMPTPVSAMDAMAPQFGLPDRHPLSLLIDPSTNVISRLVSVLPSQNHCATLIHFYFERLEWYSKVLHAPSFLSDANHLVDQVSMAINSDWDLSVLGHVSVPFLSVYLMVLCLSLHLIEPEICRRLNLGFGEAIELSKKMYNAAQACLYVSDFMGNHSLEALQCLILMGVYQQNLDEADSHWALLGSAIKMAQNLGISRLGSESENRTYSGIWKSVVKREIARRIWWSLIFNDWSHAAAHNGAYSVHPSQNHTGFPANVNDVDLVEGFPLKERPLTEYTEMTLSLTRFRFVEIYREIVDNMQSPTGYEFVMEMDIKLRKMQEEIPRYFQESDSQLVDKAASVSAGPNRAKQDVKRLELTLCLVMGETRQLRLHRPYLFKGYKDRKYAKSREQCINSARSILNLLKSNDEQSAILLKWWMVLFYGFAAAVVLFIDLCHYKADEGPDLEQRRAELREALDLFKTVEHISSVSRNAIALLEGLMSVEPDIPSKPSRKRRASSQEGDEPFGEVVKRMIIDANRTASSPGSQSSGSFGSPQNKNSHIRSPSSSNTSLHQRSRSDPHVVSGFSSLATGINEYPPRISIPVERTRGSSVSSHWTPPANRALSTNSLLLPSSEQGGQSGQDGNMVAGDMSGLSSFGLGWGLPGRDVLAPTILFRESEMFEAGMRELDEVTMNELGQLLWSDDSLGYGKNPIIDGGWNTNKTNSREQPFL